MAVSPDAKAGRQAFGRAIRRLRGSLNQTQLAKEMREAVGKPTKFAKQSQISAVETGNTYVDVEDVPAFARALKRRPRDLLVTWAEELDPEPESSGYLLFTARGSALETAALEKAAEWHQGMQDLRAMTAAQRTLVFELARTLNAKEETKR